jgi:hypothetical protein
MALKLWLASRGINETQAVAALSLYGRDRYVDISTHACPDAHKPNDSAAISRNAGQSRATRSGGDDMRLRVEMRPIEKAAWMLIISALLVVDIQSIRTAIHADNQAKSDRNAQDKAFELILKKEDAQLQEDLAVIKEKSE